MKGELRYNMTKAKKPKKKVKTGINKVKVLDVSAQVIAEIVKRAVKNKAPKDAEVIRLDYNPLKNSWRVFIRSDEFPSIPEGGILPELAPPVVSDDILK